MKAIKKIFAVEHGWTQIFFRMGVFISTTICKISTPPQIQFPIYVHLCPSVSIYFLKLSKTFLLISGLGPKLSSNPTSISVAFK